jgi:hypothetical protein
MDWIHLAEQGSVAGNELLGFIKYRELLDKIRKY